MKNITVGQRVIYVPLHAHNDLSHKDCERGVVHRIVESYGVFVKFDADVQRHGYDDATAKGCNPDTLHAEPMQPILELAEVREELTDVDHDGNCPECKIELEVGYGLAGGGCGVYYWCPKCSKIISKTQDA